MKNKYFVITVDTEEDYAFVESRNHETSVNNIKAVSRFQGLCNKYNFIPTYLCTYQVSKSSLSDKYLLPILNDDRCEIGSHLHPWLTPPGEIEKGGNNLVAPDYSKKLLYRKLDALHEAVSEKFGIYPKSFRSGRWVMNPDQLNYLIEKGYKVDSSVLPYSNYSNLSQHECKSSDYRFVNNKPYYYVNPSTYPNSSNSGILEVPVTAQAFTAGFSQKSFEWMKKNIPKFDNIFCWRTLKLGYYSLQWKTLLNSYDKVRKIINDAEKNKVKIINFPIHSNELSSGYHPLLTGKEIVDSIYNKMDNFFEFLHDKGFKGITLTKFAEKIESERNVS